MWAIHNHHTPAIEVDEAGTATHDGTVRLRLPEALHLAETREEAEAWRIEQLKRPGAEVVS